jgi:Flp pilus assembly protein TadD
VYEVHDSPPPNSDSAETGADLDAGINMVGQMIQAAKRQDAATVDNLIAQIESQPKPMAGDITEATGLNKVGLGQLKNKNYPEAADMFAQAAQKDPSDAKLLSNLGYAQTHMDDFVEANKSLLQSLVLAPRRSVAWGDLGENFARTNDPEDAVSCFLIGVKVSDGKSLGYLQSLANSQEDDARVCQAAKTALSQLPVAPQP